MEAISRSRSLFWGLLLIWCIISIILAIIKLPYLAGVWATLFFAFFIICFPSFGIAGIFTFPLIFPAVMNVLGIESKAIFVVRIGFILLAFLAYVLWKRKSNEPPPITPTTIFFTFLSLLIFIGQIYTPLKPEGIDRLLFFLYYAFIPFYLVLFMEPEYIERIFRWVFIVGLGLSMATLLYPESRILSTRITLAGGGAITYGRYYGLSIIAGLHNYFAYRTVDSPKRFFYIIAVPVIVVFLFLTGTRGALVSLAFASSLYILFFAPVKNSTRILFILGAILASVIVILTNPSLLRYRILFFSAASVSIRMRLIIWKEALQLFLEHPFFGVGTGGFSVHLPQYFSGWYPHNIILEILSEHGIVGFIIFSLFLWAVGKSLRFIFRESREKNIRALAGFCFCVLIFAFVNALFSSDIGGNKDLFLASGFIEAISIEVMRRGNKNGAPVS